MGSQLCEPTSGEWLITGVVDFKTVESLIQVGYHHLDSNTLGRCQVDFSGVTEFNSALLSMMMCWLRYACPRGIRMEFCSIPESARQMALAFGVDFLLR